MGAKSTPLPIALALGLMALSACGASDNASAPEPPAPAAPAYELTDDTRAAFAALTGDPTAGRRVFARCSSCHALAPGQNRTGPTLYGVVGRPAGAVEGFRYSQATQRSGLIWSEAMLFAYLENPSGVINGTSMSFIGLARPQQRADVIAYIKQESAN
ncbi:MAG: cytochrome c family protein [Pseudomonadota bacterium]